MCRATSPLPQFTTMAWYSVKAQGHLYLYLIDEVDGCLLYIHYSTERYNCMLSIHERNLENLLRAVK